MRAFILAGQFSLFFIFGSCLSSIAADPPPGDALIQRRIVGTWYLNWIAFQVTMTIGTNGDYVAYYTNGRSGMTRYDGTIEIRDGLMIDTLKKSSITNQPASLVHTNVIIRVTDQELVYRTQDRSNPILWEKVKQ